MKNIFKILAIALFTVSANAQVGIGTETPDASAVLDVTSADKGLLLPRLTTVARTGIATPAAGLQVYDTDTNSVWFYNGTIWTEGSGVTGPQGPAGTNGTNGTDGADGDSAYDTWIAAGNTGTEADFLNGITGADGATGPQGPAGTNGTNGVDGAVGPQGPAGDPATDDQDLTLTGNTLAISGDPNTDVDLSGYLDNTDDQTATEVTITDTASNFTATDVEGALAELVTTDSDDAWGVTGEDITSEIKRTGNVIVGGTAQIGGATPKLAVQNNDNILTTVDVTPTELLHLSRAGTEGTKWGANALFKLGSYSTHVNARSSLEIALTDTNTESTYNPVMTLNGNGKVGVGTTAPTAKFHIADDVLADLTLQSVAGLGTTQQRLRFLTHSPLRGGGLYWGDTSDTDRGSFIGRSYNNGGDTDGLAFRTTTTGENLDASIHLNPADVKMFIHDNGKVGIGTTAPTAKLTVGGYVHIEETPYPLIKLEGNQTGGEAWNIRQGTGSAVPQAGGIFRIYNTVGGLAADRIVINPTTGNVGIGTAAPSQKLHVIGNILASGTITPDYVFQKYYDGSSSLKDDYNMMSLKEIEEFTKLNKHLPGVPSYKEVEEKGGIILNRASEIQLEKIEELFLHTIEQQKTIEALKLRLEKMEKRLNVDKQ